jgi:hypothetical protein
MKSEFMKKITVFILMLLIAASSFCQQTGPAPSFTKQDYLNKSKNERNTAWILAGSGLVMTTVTSMIVANEDTASTENFVATVINLVFNNDTEDPDHKTSVTGVFFFIGAISIVTSIPLFISASKNKRKAMSISFINQPLPQLHGNSLVYHAIPSLKFKISL